MRKLFLLSLFSFSAFPVFAQLSGTYSIDGSSAASATNYVTVGDAISDMVSGTRADGGPINGPGVSAAVTIRLESGSGPYSEQLIIPAISGASATNTIRITGGPGREMITYSATTTTDRQVVKLSGARHIILDSLTFVNTGATYGYGVHITNGADSNVVSNCSVITNNTATTSNFAGITISGATVAANGDFGDDNLIMNNNVNGGYYGITMRGTGTTVFNRRNAVIGNIVQNFYYYGVYCYYQDSTIIRGNTISARVAATAAGYGIYLNYIDRFSIEQNRLFNLGGNGIYGTSANYQGGTGTARSRIVNNMIGGGWIDATSAYGIYLLTNTRYVDIWHNSISMTGSGPRAIYLTAGLGNNIQNNSCAAFGSTTGYALYVTSAATVTAVDYNNYYAPGSSNFIYVGAAFSTATYVGGGGFNVNSRDGDPVYQNNATNLHTSALQLFDAGTNVGITTDFDGQTRPMAPTAFYDIGADEYVQVLNDAGVVSSTSPVPPFGPGVQNIDVVLFNYGSATLTSAQVNWDVNTVLQTPFAWTGSVLTYTSSSPATIGTYNFISGTTYNIRVWTSNPNGVSDQQILNDTLYFTVCTALNGVYTIGGVGADYPTINSAVTAMSCGGILGPVTLNLTQGAGPFNEQVIIPAIAGTSAINTVRLNGGANREIVEYTATLTNERAVIKLNGADHIILDSMRIINNGTTYGYGVQLTNSADDNVVRNCIVQVSTTATASNFAGITLSAATVATAADNGDNNLIENNTVNGGYYSVTMRGLSTTVFDQNNIVRNNTLYNFYYYGVYCYSQNLPVIENNSISARPTATASGYGVYLYYADRFIVEENDLDSIGGNGIYCYYGNYQGGTGTQRARIANNMIGGSWRDAASAYGIYLTTNSRYIDVWHNSVSMNGTGPRALYITAGTMHDVRNNSFALYGATTGYAAYVTNTTYVSQFDYNNFYAPGSANFVYVSAAYSTATYVGGGGWNLNSRDGDPIYTDPANDLHATGPQLYDGGTNVGITNDIDGDVRPLAPSVGYDIGADEYLVLSNDNELVQIISPVSQACANSAMSVEVVITNYGVSTITSMPITAQITGYVNTTLNATYTGSLAFGQSDTVLVGTFNSNPGGTLTITAYSTLVGDQNITNDTVSVSLVITPIAPVAVGSNTSTCIGDSATLNVTTDGFLHAWYDAPAGGNLLTTGDTLTTSAITASTTYYVESANTTTNNLVTQYTGGNGCDGAMFDIVPNVNLTVDSFAINIGSVIAEQVRIYVCTTGTYVGNETNPGAWIIAGTVAVTGQGAGNPTMIPIGNINMIAGQPYGIYVTMLSANLDYTTGSQSFSNSDMTINTGAGLCALFATVNAGRIFNGTVYYSTSVCPNPVRTPITVTALTLPTVSLGNDTTACETLVLDAGNPSMTYIWSTTETTQQITATSSGQYSVAVNDGTCNGRDTINLTINPNPVLTTSIADGNLCMGESDTMYVSGAMLYSWSSGGVGTMEIVTPFTTTQYTVYGLDANGCTDTDTLLITVNAIPVVSATAADGAICLGASDTLTVTGATNYNWSSGGTGTMEIVSPGTTTTYTVNGVDANGCTAMDTVMVTVNPIPNVTVTLPLDTACTTGGSISLSGETPSGGTWSGTAVTGNSFDPLVAGVGMHAITYLYTDANGCSASAVDSMWVDLCSDIAVAEHAIIGLYPNPTSGEFTLQLGGNTPVTVTIVDAIGQVVVSEQKSPGTHRFTLPSTGVYLLIASDESGNRWTRTIISEQ